MYMAEFSAFPLGDESVILTPLSDIVELTAVAFVEDWDYATSLGKKGGLELSATRVSGSLRDCAMILTEEGRWVNGSWPPKVCEIP